jgi:hypothetical protein
LFSLHTLLNAVICCSQLNIHGVLGWFPVGGLLVIDVVGWWSMYFVVMPRVNLIVILSTYARYLYSINCPTVICLPSMLLFIWWRDTTSELWTPVQFPLHCYHLFTLLALFTFVTSQDFIEFWRKLFAFVLLEMFENSQGFKTFWVYLKALLENYFKTFYYFLEELPWERSSIQILFSILYSNLCKLACKGVNHKCVLFSKDCILKTKFER